LVETTELAHFEKTLTQTFIKIIPKAKGLVRKQLVSYISHESTEYNQMGEDFLSNVNTTLLGKIKNQSTAKAIAEAEKKGKTIKPPQYYFDMLAKDPKYIEKYLIKGVKCQCIDRAIRWSDNKKVKKKPLDESEERKINNGPAVRARGARPDSFEGSDDDWLAENAVETNHIDSIELEFSDELEEYMLEQDVTNEEIGLIKLHLSGVEYKEIAAMHGTNEKADKYRKKVYKALSKLNLTTKDLAY
jgi:hypothetical protein